MSPITSSSEMDAMIDAPRPNEKNSASPRTARQVRIVGIGSYAPEKIVTNDDLATQGYDAQWIEQRTGILARRHAEESESASDMATVAGQRCIDDAGVSADGIDMIFVATMTADHYTPSTACIVQSNLGCTAGAVDMNAACSGFVYALITASQFVQAGGSGLALVIGTDKMSCVVDPQDMKTYPLFGDGAGAVLLAAEDSPWVKNTQRAASSVVPSLDQSGGVLNFRLASVGEMGHTLIIPGGGSRMPCDMRMIENRDYYLKMDGRPVFKWAVRLIPEVITQTCHDAGLETSEIDLFVLHQANRRILDAAVKDMGLESEKFFVNLHEYGNTSAGSVPVALDEAVRSGRVHAGDKVLLMGFGAGLSWGSCIYQF